MVENSTRLTNEDIAMFVVIMGIYYLIVTLVAV